jgi:hypothetical protein
VMRRQQHVGLQGLTPVGKQRSLAPRRRSPAVHDLLITVGP